MTREQEHNYMRWRKRLIPWFKRLAEVQFEGRENIPTAGRALIVGNHRSFIDPFFVALGCPRPINFLAASFVFQLPLVSSTYRSWGALSLPLAGGGKAEATLKKAVHILKRSQLVGIFPEGVDTMLRHSLTAKVGRFHTGFARVALEARAPIIPCSVTGLGEHVLLFLPPWLNNFFTGEPKLAGGVYIYFYRKVVVRYGKPVSCQPYYEEISKRTIDRVSSKVRRIIGKLYEGEDLERFVYGEHSFDIANEYV